MPNCNRFSRGRTSSPNRSWAGVNINNVSIAAGASRFLLADIQLSNSNIDETLLRFVGELGVRPNLDNASGSIIGAVGLIVVTTEAIEAGAEAIPGPFSDSGNDGWFVHIPFQTHFFSAGTGDILVMSNKSFDFKSKRIVQDGQAVAVMLETTDNSSEGIAFNLTIQSRLLSMVKGT